MPRDPRPPHPPTRRCLGQAAGAGLLLALAGCGQLPLGAGSGSSGLTLPLEKQRRRIADAVAGTPVQVEAREGRLRVAVPLRHAHDPRQTAIKPALAAVLDQVVAGYKPHIGTCAVQALAPGDADLRGPAATQLARARAEALRTRLLERGVPAQRLGPAGVAPEGWVELWVSAR